MCVLSDVDEDDEDDENDDDEDDDKKEHEEAIVVVDTCMHCNILQNTLLHHQIIYRSLAR